MIFNPTQELIKDTYRLATLARDVGMDLHPNPSLSHIIYSWPSPSSSSCSWPFGNDSVPLPFPYLATASLFHLRLFVNLSRGFFFKLVFLKNNHSPHEKIESLNNNNGDCASSCLISRLTGERIHTMDGFTKVWLGMGWTLFKTSQDSLDRPLYLYRKLDMNKISNSIKLQNANGDGGECCRVRELRLPPLDFRNVPLRILQHILLMTGDVFLSCLD